MIDLVQFLNKFLGFFERPSILLLIIPLVLLTLFLIKKDFLKFKEDPENKVKRKRAGTIVLILRFFLITLLIIVIAGPHIFKETSITGDTYIQLLVDSSKSMDVFEDRSDFLKENLEKKVNVDVKKICLDENSNIGDEVLSSLQPEGSVLLISDGNANYGSDLGDVSLFASKINATINAISLKEIHSDASVSILGPSKTMEGSDNIFSVVIKKMGNIRKVHLSVEVNGVSIFNEETDKNVIEIEQSFGKGNHKLVARISAANDFFPQNNVFYKSVRVVDQPKILVLSESSSPLEVLLKDLYVFERKNSLPSSLKDYYAIIVNNMPAEKMDPVADVISDFISDGNGLVVFGGDNSFEKGNYRNGLFETILPVFVGSPGKKEGDVNVALVIDISGSTGGSYGSTTAVAIEKALAINAIKDLSLNTRLAVFAFHSESMMISEPSYVFEKIGLEDTIARLKHGGGTLIGGALMHAINVIGTLSGSKNIILISDGKTQQEASSIEAAKFAARLGIKIYTVGVGAITNEPLMIKYAEMTNGIYFKADQESRLRLIFGGAEEIEETGGAMGFSILDSNHFITRNLNPTASLHGFNAVFPKTVARLLATTSAGDPVLAVSRLGLGRVAVMAVDDGSKWAGDLLSKKNSNIFTRIINWGIGDSERKSKSFVEAKDTRLNEPAEIIIKSEVLPKSEDGINFKKIDQDTYTASIIPSKTGFHEVAGAIFAVNYPSEYDDIGFNKDLNYIVQNTGGMIYKVEDVDKIIENAKTKSKRTMLSKELLIWPFVIAGIFIYLLEIFIRRLLCK
jgi:hypothetical protein